MGYTAVFMADICNKSEQWNINTVDRRYTIRLYLIAEISCLLYRISYNNFKSFERLFHQFPNGMCSDKSEYSETILDVCFWTIAFDYQKYSEYHEYDHGYLMVWSRRVCNCNSGNDFIPYVVEWIYRYIERKFWFAAGYANV